MTVREIMVIAAIVTLLALIFTPFFAKDADAHGPLSEGEILAEVAWGFLHVIDTWQTLQIVDKPERYWEMNPILGRHPTEEQVWVYMGLGAIVHPIFTYLLPQYAEIFGLRFMPRFLFQSGTIMMSAFCVGNNFAIGLSGNW